MHKVKQEKNYRATLLSVHNKYWNYVFQSSEKIFRASLQETVNAVCGQIQTQAQKQYSYLLHAFSLRDAKRVLEKVLPVIFSQLLKKRTTSETQLTQPLLFLVQAQDNAGAHIL
jgi:hypothetical protein